MFGKPFDLSFFMSNALDKYGEPRMFGFRLHTHFGTEG
jgi:hypothetical protein